MGCVGSVPEPVTVAGKSDVAKCSSGMELCPAPSLGVLRLDSNYPAEKGTEAMS